MRCGGTAGGRPVEGGGSILMDSQAHFPEGAFRIDEGRRLHAALASAELGAIAPLRRRLRASLVRWKAAELADTAELLLSELVTNALLHTSYGARIEVLLEVLPGGGRRLRVEVGDHSGQPPRPRGAGRGAGPGPAEDATSGRGLLLVEALADDLGRPAARHRKDHLVRAHPRVAVPGRDQVALPLCRTFDRMVRMCVRTWRLPLEGLSEEAHPPTDRDRQESHGD